MTDEDVVAHVAKLLDCNYYTRQRQEKNTKTVFTVQLNGYKVIDLIDVLIPHMFERRKKRMNEVAAAWKMRGPAKNGPPNKK
jgi:hypothetical protein